jgi:DNA-directed RNA polymerase subunit RPC12/RpoP
MQHRCPACGADLFRRTRSVIPRMELDCPSCRARIQVNVHPVESALMMASFAAFVVFGALFYAFKQEGFLVAALAALSPAALLPFFERLWFKGWPRYRKPGARPGAETGKE